MRACRWYRAWTKFILMWALYSSFFTPLEFGFFRGLPGNLYVVDIIGQIVFLIDILLHFFLAYRDSQTYRMICKRTPIALRLVFIEFLRMHEAKIGPKYITYVILLQYASGV